MPNALRLHADFVDYLLIFLYFAVVLLIGFMARRRVSDSLDFFLSGRSLPAWVTGLAFISANLGAVEIIGMSANGAEFGMPTMHYYWIGAIPAMIFLGIVMMPFYYGSRSAASARTQTGERTARTRVFRDPEGTAHRPGGGEPAVLPVADQDGRRLPDDGRRPESDLPLRSAS